MEQPLPLRRSSQYWSWLMLNINGCRADDSFVADARTVAECRTSKGRPLRVSFGPRAAPPASSFLYFDFRRRTRNVFNCISVIAAHRDSFLLQLSNTRIPSDYEDNYFVYTAGAAGTAIAVSDPRPRLSDQVRQRL
jgi:hypothetical protein